MVTAVKTQKFRADGAQMVELYGLSVDTKPTRDIVNGSSFVEMNTGKIFLFDEENAQWLEFGGGGGS